MVVEGHASECNVLCAVTLSAPPSSLMCARSFASRSESIPSSTLPQVERWDCETVISTYSNLDNHPSVVALSRRGRSSRSQEPTSPNADKSSSAGAGDGIESQVELSAKTGLPLGVLPRRPFADG